MLAFISQQFVRPSINAFREVPTSLAIIHMLSLAVVASLAFNFLFELTSMSPKARFKVFRVELTKVFMTVVFFYLLSLLFTWWVRGCGTSVKQILSWREAKVR